MKIQEKKLYGKIYTPNWIVNLILDHLDYKENIYNKKIIDPACGDGAFLVIIVDRFIRDAMNHKIQKKEIKSLLENNIFGIDLDKNAITVCKEQLDQIAASYNIYDVEWNLYNEDSTDKSFISKLFGWFDFVVGNPPYIRIQNLPIKIRNQIQNTWSFCQKGSTDIYITFFELGYFLLNRTGRLGYITPNTYLKTHTAKMLRKFIKSKKILKELIDFEHHQLFENATTYSLITILDKSYNKDVFKLYKGKRDLIEFIDHVKLSNLNDDNWILASNQVLERLMHIQNRGIPLGKLAKIHVGLTTLADDYYIFQNPTFNSKTAEIVLKDGRIFKIEKDILKPIIKASILKDSYEDQNRYIIFPYKKIKNKHVIIPEDELKSKFPNTYKYFLSIKEILDSRDNHKPNSVSWYAFGRSQGLDTSFGKKILTSSLNLKPNFIVWEKEEYTFYAGYCIKFNGNLHRLANYLNSEDMEFYIKYVSRDYQHGYKSYAKSFIEKFGIDDQELLKLYKKDSTQQKELFF
jgi:adenine-specific DNA-methyltransferase